jgi:hypothetical protein
VGDVAGGVERFRGREVKCVDICERGNIRSGAGAGSKYAGGGGERSVAEVRKEE